MSSIRAFVNVNLRTGETVTVETVQTDAIKSFRSISAESILVTIMSSSSTLIDQSCTLLNTVTTESGVTSTSKTSLGVGTSSIRVTIVSPFSALIGIGRILSLEELDAFDIPWVWSVR